MNKKINLKRKEKKKKTKENVKRKKCKKERKTDIKSAKFYLQKKQKKMEKKTINKAIPIWELIAGQVSANFLSRHCH